MNAEDPKSRCLRYLKDAAVPWNETFVRERPLQESIIMQSLVKKDESENARQVQSMKDTADIAGQCRQCFPKMRMCPNGQVGPPNIGHNIKSLLNGVDLDNMSIIR